MFSYDELQEIVIALSERRESLKAFRDVHAARVAAVDSALQKAMNHLMYLEMLAATT